MFDVRSIGNRLLRLRTSHELTHSELGFSTHATLWRMEHGVQIPSLGYLQRICDAFGVGVKRMFETDQQFDDMLALDDDFVKQVSTFLKFLNAEQKQLILKTLEAAPKKATRGRRPSASTGQRTSTASANSTAAKDSSTPFPISPIRCSPLIASQRTKVEYRRSPHF